MSDTDNHDNTEWDGFTEPIQKIQTRDNPTAVRVDHLDEQNWIVWHDRIRFMLTHYNIERYVNGTLPCPDTYPDSANWRHNDNFVRAGCHRQ
jgi:hypothetical protein